MKQEGLNGYRIVEQGKRISIREMINSPGYLWEYYMEVYYGRNFLRYIQIYRQKFKWS